MPADAGAAIALLIAGHDVVGHAGLLQRQRFLAAAAEDERIAALQPHDAAAAPRGADHQRLNRRLRHRMTAGALADEEPLRPARVAENAVVDERVVEHEVGGAQPRDRRPRQQAGIAGTGADQRDMSAVTTTNPPVRSAMARADVRSPRSAVTVGDRHVHQAVGRR